MNTPNLREAIPEYPTLAEVLKATHFQLAKWYRFLPSPGTAAIGTEMPIFEACLKEEASVLTVIIQKFGDLGGFTPELSKALTPGRVDPTRPDVPGLLPKVDRGYP